MSDKNDPFNPAFKFLKQKLKDLPKKPAPLPKERPPKSEKDQTPDQIFEQAMSKVLPLNGPKKKIVKIIADHSRPPYPAPDEEREVLDHLTSLVNGSIEMDISCSDEYMEGAVKGFGPKMMKRLKKGEFSIQDYIDLHGLTRTEAREAVRAFLLKSHGLGLRCVLIVHGRGHNSPDSFPVLKEGLPSWLAVGPVRKIVLAFATAKPYDGGTGAVYVLLRARKGSPHFKP
ncbi:MAG: DNA mismatch repair protein MutS [Desulfobacteraceae bacterium]|nr:MAG: DNA mismatch repair protein MutS [Desulfobacteraceae bacterium]